MPRLLVMVGTDLLRHLRNLSALMYAVVVPLALIYVMNLLIGSVDELEINPVTVAVAVPEGDELAAVLPQVLEAAGEGLDLTVRAAPAEEVVGLVDDGSAGVGVVVPEGFGADLVAGAGPQVQVTLADGLGLEGTVVTSIVDGALADLTAGTRTAAAAATLGVPPTELPGIARSLQETTAPVTWREGEAADEQLTLSENIVAGQAGMFLFFTVGFGVLALVEEREQGTLRRLLSMPVRPWTVVAAKALGSFVLGLLSMGVLLTVSSLLFDGVELGSPVAVGVLVVLMVAAATSLTFVVATVARTAEQANIAQSIIAIALGMFGGAFFQLNLSGPLGALLLANPVTAFVRGLGITAGGGGVGDLGVPALVLLGFTAVCLLAAWLLPGRKELL
ncbi:ABC transporter permease [Ornithinimicrobium pekingense]|uniref:Transport permease protein n=1 Tax=Ornithinimicrobium pekingense TaxID=384677 RepID=A0ABQ2F5J8_9MICO|nr:ABC transporter permease [Ornithinimicrobium pekingense]GGK55911.1 transport permease protein [Ornithinimicrobium pekingense]